MAGMIILLSMVMLVLFIAATEKYVMPIAANICLTEAKERSNYIINSAAENVLNERGILTEDILKLKTEDGVTMISADTAAVNSICADISAYITEKLVNMENNEVKIPYGAASGIA
ncbi:MAG: hypothetical protein ACLRQB_07380, partial [Christensenellales bacterium]